jgi:hypothetical protein
MLYSDGCDLFSFFPFIYFIFNVLFFPGRKTKNPDFHPVGIIPKRLKEELAQKHMRSITTGEKGATEGIISGHECITASGKLRHPLGIHDVVLMLMHSVHTVLDIGVCVKKREFDKCYYI